jgi:hypothetical protein
MQVEQTLGKSDLKGTDEQKELASLLFKIFQARGRFYAANAPIRIPLNQLAEFMEQQQPGNEDWAQTIDAALSASKKVFARDEQDDEVAFTTTRSGSAIASAPGEMRGQVLTTRFAEPEPKRERPQRQRPSRQIDALIGATPADEHPQAPMQAIPSDVPFEVVSREDFEKTRQFVEQPKESAPVVQQPAATTIQTTLDAAAASDEDIAEAIQSTLSREMAVAQWGDQWMAEERLQRFSRGDLRRIEDFLREQESGIATDEDIVQDVLSVRPNAAEYSATVFAVNYRLSRETREFEYLGTATHGFRSLANPPAIGTSKRKTSEIGQDYRFLLDYRTPDENLEEGLIEHILSFYEYSYGVLPLDANLSTIMPQPGFAEQRAARLEFESPQTTENVIAELRFPTNNRGGFITGLEQFFADNLVPGAVVTIEKTDRPNHFLLEYFRVSAEDRKLLHFDDRKDKYAFRPTTYYCATQDEFVLSENRYPKLADAKPLDDRTRRHPEQVVIAAFERAGENVGTAAEPRYWSVFSDLLAVANIERPISAELLRDILTSGTYPEFEPDESTEDAFFYTAPTGSTA